MNRQAADSLHLNGFDWRKTRITILDAAELGDLDLMPWDKSIPHNAAWIDNYISAFGSLHVEAANVILRQGMPISLDPGTVSLYDALKVFHGYPVGWYRDTIRQPTESPMGHRWSFERSLNGSPSPGSTYVQTLMRFDHELALEGISWAEGESILWGRDARYVGQGGLLTLDMIVGGPVGTMGDVVVQVVQTGIDNLVPWTNGTAVCFAPPRRKTHGSAIRASYVSYLQETIEGAFAVEPTQARYQAAHDLIAPYVVGPEGEQPGYTLLSDPQDFYQGLDDLFDHVVERRQAVINFLESTP